MTFGTRLRLLREARHLTRRQLGEKTGISPRVIGYYETDQRLVSAVSAIRTLCLALDTTPDYLILGDPPGALRYRKQETSPCAWPRTLRRTARGSQRRSWPFWPGPNVRG